MRFPTTSTSSRPTSQPNDEGTVYLAKIIADAGLAQSAGEARRLIDGGGVKIDGEALPAKSYNVDPARIAGAVLQVGKAQVRQNKVRRGAAAPVSLVAPIAPTRPSLRRWLTAAIRPAACRLPGSRLPPAAYVPVSPPVILRARPRPPQKFFENRCKDTRRPIVL